MDIIDRFSTTLASGYTAGGTSLTLNSNVGLPSGLCDFYLLILAEGSNTEEVFHITSMSGVAATVAGAQANSTASNHASGAQVIASIWVKAAFQALDVRNTTQAAGKVFAGPSGGSPVAPGFRSLVAADLPNPGASSLGGVQSKASASHQFLTQIGTDGVVAAAQPADTDISFTDNTTGNVSTTKHGYAPKLPNDAAKFLDGTGAYSTPAGGGTVTHSAGALTSNAPVLGNGSGDIKVGTTAQLVPALPSDATKYLDGTGAWSVPAGGGGSAIYYGQDTATASGAVPQVTLGSTPLANSALLFVDGAAVDCSISGAVVTPSTVITTGQKVRAYWATSNASPGSIGLGSNPAIRGTGIQASSASSYTVGFPSGSTAGDLAVVLCGHGFALSTPSGWTSEDNQTGPNWNGAIFSKVLSSGDIGTGSVTVTTAGSYHGVIAIVVFIGGTGGVRETDSTRSSSGVSSHASSTSGSVAATDTLIYFASTRGSSTNTVDRGTLQQTADDGSAASGCLYGEYLSSAGAQTATMSYGTAGTGYYQAIVAVRS